MRRVIIYLCILMLGGHSCTKLPEHKSSDKDILSFSVGEKIISPQHGQYNISIPFTYAEAANLKKVVPHIQISDKASISPRADEEIDFTKPVTYWVTAEDNSSQRYVITPIIEKNNQAKILAFTLTSSSISGVIDEVNKVINLSVPYDFSLKSVTVSILVSENATILPESETYPLDLTRQKEFKVTAQNGVESIYTLNVFIEKNTEALITVFSLQEANKVTRYPGIINNANGEFKTIVVQVPSTCDISNMIMIESHSFGASLTPENVSDFTKSVILKVTSEDKTTTNNYIVIVNKTN